MDDFEKDYSRTWLAALLIASMALGVYFVRAKVANDSAIAKDTARAADALERLAGVGPAVLATTPPR